MVVVKEEVVLDSEAAVATHRVVRVVRSGWDGDGPPCVVFIT